jgi:hypothetical protein
MFWFNQKKRVLGKSEDALIIVSQSLRAITDYTVLGLQRGNLHPFAPGD